MNYSGNDASYKEFQGKDKFRLVGYSEASPINDNKLKAAGKVYLVGAGPGDPELLTLKAYKLLQNAEVVLYDSLISDDILQMIGVKAELIHVGKRANCHIASQSQINQKLVEHAQKGSMVVRLKGGDPFIFGRGGEELQVLSDNQINYEVVPGITAASGCSSYAGIPLTHRDFAQSVRLITAHQKQQETIDWHSLAAEKQTLVFYMGLLRNKVISDSLIKHGLNAKTPVAVIENGTRENQRVLTGRLDQLSELVEENDIQMPSLILVGEVVALSKQLAWFNTTGEVKASTESAMRVLSA